MTHRWFTENDDSHSQSYAERFRELAAQGSDLDGEARLLDAIVKPRSSILDAGCGQGRTAHALTVRGHAVVAVDIDATLLDAAKIDNPGPTYVLADLATLDLRNDDGAALQFDAAVSAGNVITYVAPDTEVDVLRAVRRHLKSDAPYVLGFHTDRYSTHAFDRHLTAAGFTLESRFCTWDLRPWRDDADFAVSVLRKG